LNWPSRPSIDGKSPTTQTSSHDAPEMLYARIAEEGVNQSQKPISDPSKSVFLGEAFSLTYVVHDVLAPFLANDKPRSYHRRLHYPFTSQEASSPRKHISSQQYDFLQQRGIWFKPSPDTGKRLLECFFEYFHPAFPILDPNKTLESYESDELSLLVLNSVFLIAISICDGSTLEDAGCGGRYEARSVFYNQAKALYDADLEPDKVNNIVGVFYMSWWWSGPDSQKDTWHWMSIATSLAQSLGMHRSTINSGMDSTVSSAWRRIWWSIRVRDALVSGSIGRPQHISDSDCDVELLLPTDVQDVLETRSFDVHDKEKLLYSSEMAKLSIIFSQVITSRYASPASSAQSPRRQELEESLEKFHRNIPESLRYRGVDTEGKGLWSAMLLNATGYATILLCRPLRSISGEEETDNWGNTAKAFVAANEITRTMEDILLASLGRSCQIHSIPAIFNAMAMHVFAICTSNPLGRELAENRARICMHGLAKMQESWPVGGWVYRLWIPIMERLRARRAHNQPQHTSTNKDGLFQEESVNDTARTLMNLQNGVSVVGPDGTQSFGFWNSDSSTLHGLQDMTGHPMPDIFAFDNHSNTQADFFSMLNVPIWNHFEN
jgi:hypothetical protein